LAAAEQDAREWEERCAAAVEGRAAAERQAAAAEERALLAAAAAAAAGKGGEKEVAAAVAAAEVRVAANPHPGPSLPLASALAPARTLTRCAWRLLLTLTLP
jgi:hypothetical protein